MKKRIISMILCLAMLLSMLVSVPMTVNAETAEPPTLYGKDAPTDAQYAYATSELSAFLHFSINTFTGREWGTGSETPDQFTLTEKIDAEAYVKPLVDAGFKTLIVTAKHHDGFCIWDSAYTDHDIASTSYPGDVLEDLSAACSKYNMPMGLYLSPWDMHEPSYGNDTEGDYNEYFINQLHEILGNEKYGCNGTWSEVWFDDAKGSNALEQDYDYFGWADVVKSYNPDTLICGNTNFGTQLDTRLAWNESGYTLDETWSYYSFGTNASGSVWCAYGDFYSADNAPEGIACQTGLKGGNSYIVTECDVSITSGWFWGAEKETPKSDTELRDIYMRTVGRGAVLLMNVPLNNEGKLPEKIGEAVTTLGNNIKESFANNLLFSDGVTATASSERGSNYSIANTMDGDADTYYAAAEGEKSATLEYSFDAPITFDAVTFSEEIRLGQRIESFEVYYKNGGAWTEYFSGATVGTKRIAFGVPVEADGIKIVLNGIDTSASPVITEVGVYKVNDGFEKREAASLGFDMIHSSNEAFTSDEFEKVTDVYAKNASYLYGEVCESVEIAFDGTYAYLIGGADANTVLEISVDGGEGQIIDLATADLGTVLFRSGTLTDGSHKMSVKVLAGGIKLEALYQLDNGGAGFIEFERDEYTVSEDESIKFKLHRMGGSTGAMSVIVQDTPSSAVQSHYYPTEGISVAFAEGETEKTVTVKTKRYTSQTGTLDFKLKIVADSENTALGMNTPVTVKIRDTETEYAQYELTGLEFTASADKTAYLVGESVDTSGLKLNAIYTAPIGERISIVESGGEIGYGKEHVLETPILATDFIFTHRGTSSAEWGVISEIEIYDAEGNNIARNADLYISMEYNSSGKKLNDGKKDKHSWNYWQPGSAKYAGTYPDPHAIFTWDEPVEIHKIVIYEYADEIAFAVTDYSLDYELNKKIESVSLDDCTVSPKTFIAAGTVSVTLSLGDVQTSYKVKVEEPEKGALDPSLTPTVWFDASDIEAEDGDSVSVLENKASPGTHDATQSDTALLPTYVKSSTVNGKPSLRFDYDSELVIAGTETNYSAMSIFIVMNASEYSADDNNYVLSKALKSGTSWKFTVNGGKLEFYSMSEWGSEHKLTNESTLPIGESNIYSMVSTRGSGVNTYLYKNGVLTASGGLQKSWNPAAKTPIRIGGVSSVPFDGICADIAEILIYDRALSSEEISLVNSYLNEKWLKEEFDGAMKYDGFSVRTSSYNGLRSVFYFDDTAEYSGYTLKEYGALAVASVNKPTDGNYLKNDNGNIVSSAANIKKIAVRQDGELVGKHLVSEYSGMTKFGVTIINFGAEHMKNDVYVCGYEVWTNNSTGEDEIIYTEYENPLFRDISLYDMSLGMYKSGFLNSSNEDGIVWDTLTTAGAVTLNEGADYITTDDFGSTFKYIEISATHQTSTAADGITFAETDITVTLIEDGESYVAFYRGNSGSIPAADIYGGMFPQLSSGFAQPSQHYSGKISAALSPTLTYDTSMKIKTVVIDSGISEIGSYAFSGCGLEALVYPASCTVIGTGALAYATAFKTAHIAGGVVAEGVADMSGIEEFVLDGYYLFRGCTSLEKLCISDGASVGGVKFAEGATSLLGVWCESGKYAEGVIDLSTSGATKIGNGAFGNCVKITAIKLPASVTDIADDAFEGITNIEIIQE